MENLFDDDLMRKLKELKEQNMHFKPNKPSASRFGSRGDRNAYSVRSKPLKCYNKKGVSTSPTKVAAFPNRNVIVSTMWVIQKIWSALESKLVNMTQINPAAWLMPIWQRVIHKVAAMHIMTCPLVNLFFAIHQIISKGVSCLTIMTNGLK